mmetsp:Transcript_69516/g.137522  ORF Transcript_69516/g.137522 Transcript_69516/m.137522 type:complete len:218 (+) Transcript_69516:2122-2775(+)
MQTAIKRHDQGHCVFCHSVGTISRNAQDCNTQLLCCVHVDTIKARAPQQHKLNATCFKLLKHMPADIIIDEEACSVRTSAHLSGGNSAGLLNEKRARELVKDRLHELLHVWGRGIDGNFHFNVLNTSVENVGKVHLAILGWDKAGKEFCEHCRRENIRFKGAEDVLKLTSWQEPILVRASLHQYLLNVHHLATTKGFPQGVSCASRMCHCGEAAECA